MSGQVEPKLEEALASILQEIQKLRQPGFTQISVRNPDTGAEHKLAFPLPARRPLLDKPTLFTDSAPRYCMGLHREIYSEAQLIGEIYINPKYPDRVGVQFRYTSLTPEEAQIVAAELLDVAKRVEETA